MQEPADRLPSPGRRFFFRFLWSLVGHDLGVDLGTANTLIYVRGRGIMLAQPSVVAVDREAERVVAVGDRAREMLGRAQPPIEVVRPLRSGVITDYDAAQFMLREFMLRVHHRRRFVQPRVVVCVPTGLTQVALRAVEEAALEAGARRVTIVAEPLAAGVGAGLPVDEPRGSMVVDVGGGTTEVAVFVMGGIIAGTSSPVAGDAIDAAIASFVRKEHGVLVGERTAERIKIVAGSASPGGRKGTIEFLGRDLATGRPRKVRMSSDELQDGMAEPVADIVDAVLSVFERMPPEILRDVAESGITLTGGGALLAGLSRRIAIETGLGVNVDPEPLTCVARGAGVLLDRMRGRSRRRPTESRRRRDSGPTGLLSR